MSNTHQQSDILSAGRSMSLASSVSTEDTRSNKWAIVTWQNKSHLLSSGGNATQDEMVYEPWDEESVDLIRRNTKDP